MQTQSMSIFSSVSGIRSVCQRHCNPYVKVHHFKLLFRCQATTGQTCEVVDTGTVSLGTGMYLLVDCQLSDPSVTKYSGVRSSN